MTTTTILLIIACAWLALCIPAAFILARAIRNADERERPPAAPDDARDIDGLADD